jgi:hypothetical protein
MALAHFTTQSYPTLRAAYGTRSWREADLALLPSYAKPPLATLLGQPIAEDFQLLSPAALHGQNEELTNSSRAVARQWLVFACSGQGDDWLLHKHRNETGFYDHNTEQYPLSTVAELHLPLEAWVIGADLFQQFDTLLQTTPTAFTREYRLKPAYKAAFISQLNSLSPALFERLPFKTL